jgi:hypothetical protein
MNSKFRIALLVSLFCTLVAPLRAQNNPFIGSWALTLPKGEPGWLGVSNVNGTLRASLLWVSGSVEPLQSAHVSGDKLELTRVHRSERKDASGKTVRTNLTENITATLNGDDMTLSSRMPRASGSSTESTFHGKRLPDPGPAPDLSQVKFGPPIVLFDGKDLGGWRPVEEGAFNGWSARDGLLVNTQEKPAPGGRKKSYANLRTDREFNDFKLTLETRLAKGGNSGVYIRGIYEVQVADTYGKRLDSHNMGAIYSRITPTAAAEKPPGEWQTMEITFVKRHATVVLNGQKIIDNKPVLGCTGGALWSDVFRPGPIMLQGDHTGIEYRNIVIQPVAED